MAINHAETWRPYPVDPRYSVSNEGRIRRDVQVGSWRPGLCSLSISKRGYYVTCVGGSVVNVHQVVARTFHPNPKGLPEVAHNDGNKLNNRPENLRWATRKDNSDDIDRHGKRLRGDTHPSRILSEADVLVIRKALAGKRPRRKPHHKDLAQEFGVTRECITRIANNERWRHATPR